MQVSDGDWASRATVDRATRSAERSRMEAEFVDALLTVTHEGVALDKMTPGERRYMESLLEGISQIRSGTPLPVGMAVNVREVRLDVSTSVSAKGL